jgi:hypothetical protein
MAVRSVLVVAVIIVAVAAAGVINLWFGGPTVFTTATGQDTVSEQNPFGQSRDRNDPCEQHYIHGRYPEAMACFTEAAAKGNPRAAHRLGVEYMDGKRWVMGESCTSQRCPDYAKAMQYHRQAALAGNALSMFDIGSLYEHGLGVAKNLTEAARWYGYSARYGLAQGQYNYATMLEAGEGVPKDEVEAYKFFVLAARGGFTGIPYDAQRGVIDQRAPTPVELLQRRLTPEQIREGQARADAFKPLKGPLKLE